MRQGSKGAAPADEVETLRAQVAALEEQIAALGQDHETALAEKAQLERELGLERFRAGKERSRRHEELKLVKAAALDEKARLERELEGKRFLADKERSRRHEELKLAKAQLALAVAENEQQLRHLEALTREVEALQAQNARLQARLARAGADSGEAMDARTRFETARTHQLCGDIAMAAQVYAEVGPDLPRFLAQDAPSGRQITGPDFLIIGAPRAGTTWLKRRLARHPQLFILAGEHHYFSASPDRSAESYVARFAARGTKYLRPHGRYARPKKRLYGEKSTTYLVMPDSQIDLCAALFPKLRLICMVREPVSRAWSHIKHLGHGARAGDLEYLQSLSPWHSLDAVVDYGRYERHLARWALRFAPEQMLLIDFERIAAEPEAVFRETVAHIGAEPDLSPWESEPVGASANTSPPEALQAHLQAVCGNEVFDVAELRRAMEAAAAQAMGRPT